MTRFRPVDPAGDAELLHRWVRSPHARFWGMSTATVDDVRREYERLAQDPGSTAELLLDVHGVPVALTERYDPARHPVAEHLEVRPGDVGMHVLVAPRDGLRVPGFTGAVFRAVMARCFQDPSVSRVVVEPDVRNAAVHARNAEVGFRVLGSVELPDKTALLSVCTRQRFETLHGDDDAAAAS